MIYKTHIVFRKETLIKLLNTIIMHENEFIQAVYDDFRKPAFEAVLTETNNVILELKDTIKSLNRWARPKRVPPSLLNFPSTNYIYKVPYGKVLVIAPWNYPFRFGLCYLIWAIAAGNQVVLKPSELTPNTSATNTTYSFGGSCINDAVMYSSNKRLPFCGAGHSWNC